MEKEMRKKRAKGFISGFKEFIMKGNILDLAIAVVIGAAFGKIITSLVNDIIMPPIALLLGDVNFKDLVWVIKESVVNGEVVKVTINYGNFIQNIVEFLIIAFSIYSAINLVIRRKEFNEKIANMDKEEEPEEVVVAEDIQLLTEIRDQLKEINKRE